MYERGTRDSINSAETADRCWNGVDYGYKKQYRYVIICPCYRRGIHMYNTYEKKTNFFGGLIGALIGYSAITAKDAGESSTE